MENRFNKLMLLLLIIIGSINGNSQGNPGFLGKKIAVGYNIQYSIINSKDVDFGVSAGINRRILTNHDFYCEYSTGKFTSISGHIAYQKAPVWSYTGDNGSSVTLPQSNMLNDTNYTTYYKINGGVCDFSMLCVGFKYSVFNPNKTISAPVGFSQYLRMDIISTKAVKNNYIYEIENMEELNAAQIQNSKIPEPQNTRAINVSFGYGVESKLLLSRSLFLRINGEFNLSSGLLKKSADNSSYSSQEEFSINEDLRIKSMYVDMLRNLLLVGVGVGVLL